MNYIFLSLQINSTYSCFIDPNNIEQRPLKYKPNIKSAHNDFIRYMVPMSILAALLCIILFISIIRFFIMICKLRPRCLFRVRTYPTTTTWLTDEFYECIIFCLHICHVLFYCQFVFNWIEKFLQWIELTTFFRWFA